MDDLILKNRYLTEEVERQTQEVQRHIDRMAAMNQVASIVSQSLDLDRTLNNALRVVANVIGAEAGGISLIDEATNEVVLREQLGWENNFVSPPMRVPAGEGMSGQVIQNDEVLVVRDLEQIDNIAVQRVKEEAFQSIVMAPMHARGKIIGILSVMSKTDEHFDDASVDLLRAIADTVGIALDNARLYQQSVENENRLSAVLKSTADGIITTDHSGTIRMINPSAERMLDIRTPAVRNRPLREAPIPRAQRPAPASPVLPRRIPGKVFPGQHAR